MNDESQRGATDGAAFAGTTGCGPTAGEPPDGAEQQSPPAEEAPDGDKPKPAKPKKKRRKKSPGVRFLIKLGVVAAVCAIVFLFVLGLRIQRGNEMYPFIMDGDLLITYKLDDYRVGDPVVYRNPKTGETAVSRIVAVGAGDVEITETGQLLINDYIPSEQVFYPTKPLAGSEITFPYQMSEDGYFLLDDYRTIGKDSRAFGEVKREHLLGKVVYVFRRRGI